jgi:hypothetical protein
LHFYNEIVLDYPPSKRLFAGFDNLGKALEIVAIEDDEHERLAVENGNYRKATKKESMEVRLAALSVIVHEMQDIVKKDKELAHT